MKIAFYGDSLTAGNFGASFVDFLKGRLPAFELRNYGEGGDTVIGLYHRLSQMQPMERTDFSVLWIGVNDIFARMTWLYRIMNRIRMKPCASNRDEFAAFYRSILDILLLYSDKVIAVPPLFIGEDLESTCNRKLEELSAEIQTLASEYENVEYAKLREVFMGQLKAGQVSSYLPTSMIQFFRDKSACSSVEKVDQRSTKRGLQFTLDGVHLNSKGAEIVAEYLEHRIEELIGS